MRVESTLTERGFRIRGNADSTNSGLHAPSGAFRGTLRRSGYTSRRTLVHREGRRATERGYQATAEDAEVRTGGANGRTGTTSTFMVAGAATSPLDPGLERQVEAEVRVGQEQYADAWHLLNIAAAPNAGPSLQVARNCSTQRRRDRRDAETMNWGNQKSRMRRYLAETHGRRGRSCYLSPLNRNENANEMNQGANTLWFLRREGCWSPDASAPLRSLRLCVL